MQKTTLNDSEKDLIKKCIMKNEQKTNCEIVPMIVSDSDFYPMANHRLSVLMAFIFFLILYFSPYSFINPLNYLYVQIFGLFTGHFLAYIPFIKRLFLTKDEMHRESEQRAQEAFLQNNIHSTPNQLGLLVFISLLERRIILITDVGIKEKIDQKVWDEIVHEFTSEMKSNSLANNTIKLLDQIAHVLENYFPRTEIKKTNHLKDDLIL